MPQVGGDISAANDPQTTEPVSQPARPDAAGLRITAFQQAHIKRLAQEVGCEMERVLSYFGVQHLKDVRVADFPRVVRSLEKRRTAA